jgi:hypothetical protein
MIKPESGMKISMSVAGKLSWVPLSAFALIPASLYLFYRMLLPKPLPGIPYHKNAVRSPLGDIPNMIRHAKEKGRLLTFFTSLNENFNSPIVQIWAGIFDKPTLVISDYQESQDILIRRPKEFDRSGMTVEVFAGVLPYHHIAMKTADPRFRGNKEFVRDLMSPNFLRDVSY